MHIKNESLWRSIIECHEQGLTASETADRVNCSLPMCYKVSQTIGFMWANKTRECVNDRLAKITEMLEQGMTKREIADALLISKNTVKYYQRSRKLKSNVKKHKGGVPSLPEGIVSDRIRNKCDGLIYISGYKNNKSDVIVKCPDCGNVFQKNYITLTNYWTGCQFCKDKQKAVQKAVQKAIREAELDEEKRQKEIELEAARELRERQNEKKRQRLDRELNKKRTCVYCGKSFTKAETGKDLYCSDKCSKRMAYKRKEDARNQRLKGRKNDKDITLARLYKRDAGRCWICGMQCNYEDYTTIDNTFIAGNYYPSIDHVIPIAKGGENTWDNVKLAHRICNTIKRDEIYAAGGQNP